MKQTKNDAVATSPSVKPMDAEAMRAMIGEDLNRAEVGMFSMLRAGVGLLCYKNLSEFGEWEARLMELCPGKSTRTLQNYMQQARAFVTEHEISPETAWDELRKIDATQVGSLMLAAPQQAQLAEGIAEPAAKKARKTREPQADEAGAAGGATFAQMLLDFIQQRRAAKKNAEPPKPLTKREKVDAAIAEADRIVNISADWIADGTFALLPDDELESTMAGIRSVADKLRDEFRKRQAKI